MLSSLLVAIVSFALTNCPSAAQHNQGQRLTGVELQARLDSTVSVRLSGQPLRASLDHLADAYEVAMFLDRRIDPGQPLDLQLSEVPLRKGLDLLASERRLGTAQVGSVIYIGPAESAHDISTLAALAREEAEQVPQQKKAALFKFAPLAWEELATPRDLIEQTAKSAGLKLVGLDKVPHDLWAANSWPAMNVIDRLTLLAIGFDLQIRVSKAGDAVALVPRLSPARMVKSYPAGVKPDEIAKKLAEYLPEAEFKVADGKLFVRARWEDHQQVQAALRGQPLTRTTPAQPGDTEPGPTGIRIYTLKVQNKPLRPILETLAKQMNLTLRMDDASLQMAGIDPQQLISFEVKAVQRDELWKAATAAAGLIYQLDGETIVVSPGEK